MELKLSKEDVEKILSTLDIEDIENRLDANYSHWDILNDNCDPFILTKKEE